MIKSKSTRLFYLFSAFILLINLIHPVLIYSEEMQAPTITAEGAILIDAKTGKILYEKNANEKFYPASITKLMTALLVIENLKPTDTVTFSQEAIYGIEYGSSHIGMRIGEQITIDQALHALLLMSANEVANGLAEAVSGSMDHFALLMTQRAQQLGAKNTNFVNPHGLHDPNHYTTPYDMSLIMKELYNKEYFLEIMSESVYQIPPTNKSSEPRPLSQDHRMLNERRDSKRYRSDVIGGKTGYTDEARHTLVTASRQGEIDLIAVVMRSQKDTIYSDTAALLDYGFNSYHTLKLHDENTTLTSLPVYSIQSGELYKSATCDISVVSNDSLLLSKDIKLQDITTNLHLPEYLPLGSQKNQTVGTIDYIYNNQILASNNLVINSIHYTPSPFTNNNPPSSQLTLMPEWIIFICIILLIIIVFLHHFKRRKYNFSNKTKKLKFSKTLK